MWKVRGGGHKGLNGQSPGRPMLGRGTSIHLGTWSYSVMTGPFPSMTGASKGVKLNKSVFRISVRLNHTERDKRREPSTAAGF